MQTVLRYVKSSRDSEGPLVAIQQDLPHMIVHRRAAFPVEYGVTGKELMAKLRWAAETFVKAMELQGLTLIPLPEGNPQVVTDNHGRPYGTYSITHDLEKAAPDELQDAKDGSGPATLKQPQSLEDSHGKVDYQIVGVFWAPQVSIEIARKREDILQEEKDAKNPTVFGGGTQTTPNTPSIAR